MNFFAPNGSPTALFKVLQDDLRRRLAAVGRYDAHTLQTLGGREIAAIVAAGIVIPLALAWWLL